MTQPTNRPEANEPDPLGDWCVYPDDGEDTYYTTCIKPEHIRDWLDCAKVDDLELSGRLLDIQRQLAILGLQARSRLTHLPKGESRIRPRFLVQHLTAASASVREGLKQVSPR